jgi:hypothetical protein
MKEFVLGLLPWYMYLLPVYMWSVFSFARSMPIDYEPDDKEGKQHEFKRIREGILPHLIAISVFWVVAGTIALLITQEYSTSLTIALAGTLTFMLKMEEDAYKAQGFPLYAKLAGAAKWSHMAGSL